MLNIIGKRKIWYGISAVMLIPGIISLIFNGLKLGIDFKGGTLMEVQMVDQTSIDTEAVREALAPLELGNLVVQSSGTNQVIIRTDTLTVEDSPANHQTETDTTIPQENDGTDANQISWLAQTAFAQDNPDSITSTETTEQPIVTIEPTEAIIETDPIDSRDQTQTVNILGGTEKYNEIISLLQEKFGRIQELRFEAIGPTVSNDLANKTIWAVIIASICIIIYIAWAFRNVPAPTSSWRFGLCAVAALLHDALFVLGLFSIGGAYFNIELDILFLPAILTVMSFSVHDSIVVFDRVRENLRKLTRTPFEEVVNISVNETLVRSLNLSLTVIITLAALYLFASTSIHVFLLTLIIGLISGTYSSIFNASPLLVTWHYWADKNKQS